MKKLISMKPNLDLSWYPQEEIDIKNISETPLVFVHLDRIGFVLNELRINLKKNINNFSIYYALKACYLQPIIQTLKELGIDGVEVISPLEKEIAVRSEFSGNQIIYNGLFRDKEDLKTTIAQGGIVNIDSLEELEALEHEDDIKIGLRVHPNFEGDGNFVSRGSKLGMDLIRFQQALKICKQNNFIIKGVHFHIFSNLTNAKDISKAIESVANLIRYSEKFLRYKMKYLDIGGGFSPMMFFSEENKFETFIQVISETVKNTASHLRLILELGRFLVSDSAFIISKVKGIKVSYGKKWAILDIGTNYLIPAPGAQFKVLPINLQIAENGENIAFADIICSPAGVIDENQYFSNLKKDDLVLVSNVGAYTNVMKEQFVLSDPKCIFLKNGKVVKVSKKLSLNEVLQYHGWE